MRSALYPKPYTFCLTPVFFLTPAIFFAPLILRLAPYAVRLFFAMRPAPCALPYALCPTLLAFILLPLSFILSSFAVRPEPCAVRRAPCAFTLNPPPSTFHPLPSTLLFSSIQHPNFQVPNVPPCALGPSFFPTFSPSQLLTFCPGHAPCAVRREP